jgi:hypothetical protein
MAFKYDILGEEYYGNGMVLIENNRGHEAFRVTRASNQYTTGTAYGYYTHTRGGIAGSISVAIGLKDLSVSGAVEVDKMTDTGVTFSF